MTPRLLFPVLGALALCLSACGGDTPSSDGAEAQPLVVYSSRNEQLIKPVFDRYSAETGQPIAFITGKEGPLLQRLRSEGADSDADLLLTVDAGNLWKAADDGVLATVESETLDGRIPVHLRDPEGRWYGLSVRARTIVYSTERVDPEQLSTYEALADDPWADRLCLRTSRKVYNQSLVAMLIAAHGEARTEEIVRGWVGNLAAEPFANDTAVMEAIAAGQCDVGIVNTYYFGRLQRDNPDINLALFWPNQADDLDDARGVHVNISGAGVTAASDQREAAVAFLEWMAGETAQDLIADGNLEYPANPDVPAAPRVKSWGDFVPNIINVSQAGALQADAVRLMERAGYR